MRKTKPYRETRPWGNFIQYTNNEKTTVKIITVNPGELLSYQYHENRDELWVPLTEGLEVTLDGKKFKPEAYQEVFIPRGTKHRAAGVGKRNAKWLEISFGEFDEEDEVRVEDAYGRT